MTEEIDLLDGGPVSEPEEPSVVSRAEPEELNKIAVDLAEGKIFCTGHLLEHEQTMVGVVFMPIALGALANFSEDEIKNIGCIYEYISEASPRSINGLPSFFSMRILHVDDWDIVKEKYTTYKDKMEAAREAL